MKYLKTFEAKIRHNFTDKMVTDIKGIFIDMKDLGTKIQINDIKGGISILLTDGPAFSLDKIEDSALMLIDYMKIECNENILVNYEIHFYNNNYRVYQFNDLDKVPEWLNENITSFKIKIIF
jgi:hypothetical protein